MLMGRNELRRLEKAAREKDKKHLLEWADAFEQQVVTSVRQVYEQAYTEEVQSSIDNFIAALCYTLVYTEEWDFNPKNLGDFLSDLFATVDLYRTGESKPQEFREDLKQYGVTIDDYDYSKVFKNKDKKYNELVETYFKKIEELDKLKIDYENKLEQLNSQNK